MQHQESTQQKVSRLRGLNETEKLSLIFTQQRKMSEFQERLEAFQCAHQTGTCPLCQDKDLTIAQLQQQNERLRDKLYSRSSERRKKGKKKRVGKRGNQKGGSAQRVRLPSEQFPGARIEECTLQDATPPECDQCAQPMGDSGMRETSERLEYQPAEVYILRTHRVRYHCKCCQSAPKTATLPERMAPGSSFGDSFIIQASISKFYDLIPTTRFAKILARGNAAVSHGLLLKALSIMAFVLVSLYRAIKQEIVNSRVVFADETIH